MPETLVLCGGLERPRRASNSLLELDIDVNAPPKKRVWLRLETLTRRLVGNPAAALCDALEIAAYIFIADRMTRRGSDQLPKMGADWRRSLRFRIPVRCHELWTRSDISECLTSTLGFLSEDTFVFEFVRGGDAGVGLEPFLALDDPGAQIIKPDDIILFSGGLDSLAGTVEQLFGHQRDVVLVTHQSANAVTSRQNALVEQLKARSADRKLFYAPVQVLKGDYDPVEHTQRCRSFLFVALGMFVASVFRRDELLFFENGITSFNLPIAEHVLGTRASRTTHPKVLGSFSRLFSLIADRPVNIENRYLWHTKQDVVEVLARNNCADLIGATTSCAAVRSLSMTSKQCGVCSQCIERRYAILGAGLDDYEKAAAYAIDPFTGAHTKAIDVTMAEQHASRASLLASMTEHAFLGRFGQVFRALPNLQGSASENATKVFELHKRYGKAAIDVLNGQLKKHADFGLTLQLPPTSLIAMINAATGPSAPVLRRTEDEPTPSVQPALDDRAVKSRRISFALDDAEKLVIFDDGPTLIGADYKVFKFLAEQHKKDIESGIDKQAFKTFRLKTLANELRISEDILLQRVSRMRKSLKKQFEEHIDYIIDRQDIIQSASWGGYRLNPYLLQIALSDLRPRESHDTRTERHISAESH